MMTIEEQAAKLADAIIGVYGNEPVQNLGLAAALGMAAACLFQAYETTLHPGSGQAALQLCKDTMDKVFEPATAQVTELELAGYRRYPRHVFPPCSSCGQDHHPSMDCVEK
jgi:hypothetical protein